MLGNLNAHRPVSRHRVFVHAVVFDRRTARTYPVGVVVDFGPRAAVTDGALRLARVWFLGWFHICTSSSSATMSAWVVVGALLKFT